MEKKDTNKSARLLKKERALGNRVTKKRGHGRKRIFSKAWKIFSGLSSVGVFICIRFVVNGS